MIKKLTKGLKGHKNLVFLDFEGTQFSHEMIALGGIAVTIDPKTGRIKKRKKPIRIYVLAKNKIGNYVVNLTGITEETLRSKGVIFDTAMRELKKYCGISFKKSTFITFGNHDLRILNQSISYNIKYPKDVTSQIQKNYFDFGAFISEFIRDEKVCQIKIQQSKMFLANTFLKAREHPGGSVVKTLPSHYRRPKFNHWSGK